jgi:hypothetical protein
VDLRFSRPRPSFRLGLALRVAAAQLYEPGLDWSGVLVTRVESSGKRPTAAVTRLSIRGEGLERARHAHQLFAMAVQLLAWARRDAVPYFDRASHDLAHADLGAAYGHLDDDLNDRFQALLWPDVSVESLQRDPVLPLDPQAVAASGAPGRGDATALWVWDVFDQCVELLGTVGAADEGGDE